MTETIPTALPDVQMDELIAKLHKARAGVHDRFATAFAEMDASLDSEKMSRDISAMLITERRQLAYTLLGIDTSWGRLELKQSSNNNTMPLAGHMRDMALKAVGDFFQANPDYFATELTKVIDTPPMKKAMRDEYRRVYEYQFRQHINKLAERAAAADAEKTHKEIMAALSLKTSVPTP